MNQDKEFKNEKQPLVSVIIPCYNGEKFIGEAIESVLNQTYQNWELIIVNDGSTDHSKEIVKKYLTDNRIQYIEHRENKGIPSARNTGIKASKGEYIALLDQDDLWVNKRLELLVNKFNEFENNVGFIFSNIKIFIDGSIKQKKIKKVDYAYLGEISNKNLIKELFLRNTIKTVSQVLIKKECFDVIGLFDESLKGGDDRDFYMRSASKYEFKYIDELLTLYRYHENNSCKKLTLNMLEEELNIRIPKIIKIYPFLQKYIKIKYSNLFYRYGVYYTKLKDIKKAKYYFNKSIKMNIFNWKAFARMIICILNKNRKNRR